MDSVNLNINLNFEQLLEAVRQLSPKDKLKINDAIWEDTSDIPMEQQDLVLSRAEASEKNPERLLDWDEVVKTL